MKCFIQVFLILTSFFTFSQSNTFCLKSLLDKEVLSLKDEHGIAFIENEKLISNSKVKKDFKSILKILKILKIEFYQFNISNIDEEINKISILQSKISNSKIIQIKSIIYTNKSRYEIIKYNFLVNYGKNKIYLEFDENGISSYSMNNRKVIVNREVILEPIEEFDSQKFYSVIELAKSKYLK